jgi:hypothetical protein
MGEGVSPAKYAPLTERLRSQIAESDGTLDMTFDAIGRLVGQLPHSAYRHREWWANGSHAHQRSWQDAGWRVGSIDMRGQRVTFHRTSATASPRVDRGLSRQTSALGVAVDRVDLELHLQWHDSGRVSLDRSGRPTFPSVPAAPGLYRMTFQPSGSSRRARMYIGEAANLQQRVSGYRNPGPSQATNLRLNARLREQLAKGAGVRLAIALEAHGRIGDECEAQPLDLSLKAVRLLAENAALVKTYLADDADIENL